MAPVIGHRLRDVLERAARGSFPPADGAVEVMAPARPTSHAVVELTGHSYVLTDRAPAEVEARGVHGYGGCTHPAFLQWLAGDDAEIGSLDVVLVARGAGDALAPLTERTDLAAHPRVARALHHRRDVRVFGDERGVVTLGSGLVDRLEMSVELTGAEPGAGAGRSLVSAGLGLVELGRPVWAQVAPGNAASLRAFLAAGFVPVGSEVLLTLPGPTT